MYKWNYLCEHKFFIRHKIVNHFIPIHTKLIYEIGPGESPLIKCPNFFTLAEYKSTEQLSIEDIPYLSLFESVALIWIGMDLYIPSIEEFLKRPEIKFKVFEAAIDNEKSGISRIKELLGQPNYSFIMDLGRKSFGKRELIIYE
jgi:hypothetical protein